MVREAHDEVEPRTVNASSAQSAGLPPGHRIGPYQVERPLGHGGMSDVYLAQDTRENRSVVLKFPHDEILGDPTSYEHFQREVKIGKMLTHPNIQKLYALENIDGARFLVLEYVPGRTLRDVLREHKKKADTTHEIVNLFLQVAHALAHAHAHHVIHRDLKPENILVTPEGQAKIMDFGIAYVRGARRVTWGPLSSQVGTPDYMAPEQIQGVRGDARTDIYALGMMLYEGVAGRLPYDGDNSLAVMNQHVNVPAPPMHRYRKGVDPALEEIILKAIRRNPDHRWPTIQGFIGALEHPEQVALDVLRADRENERESGGALQAHSSDLGLPVGKAVMIVLAIFLAVTVVGFLAQFLHTAGK